MKKLMTLSLLLIAVANSYAVNLKPNSSNSTVAPSANTSNNNTQNNVKDWMRTQTGTILVFDTSQKITIINDKSYVLDNTLKVYDGTPKKGSLVKFNTNADHHIIDLWVIKK